MWSCRDFYHALLEIEPCVKFGPWWIHDKNQRWNGNYYLLNFFERIIRNLINQEHEEFESVRYKEPWEILPLPKFWIFIFVPLPNLTWPDPWYGWGYQSVVSLPWISSSFPKCWVWFTCILSLVNLLFWGTFAGPKTRHSHLYGLWPIRLHRTRVVMGRWQIVTAATTGQPSPCPRKPLPPP